MTQNRRKQRLDEIDSAVKEIDIALSLKNVEHAQDWFSVLKIRIKRLDSVLTDHHAVHGQIAGDTCVICQPREAA